MRQQRVEAWRVAASVVMAWLGTIGGCTATADEQAPAAGEQQQQPAAASAQPRTVRDLMWVWGTPERATPGGHTLATYAEAPPAEQAKLLGVRNITMCGAGLPADDAKAEEFTAAAATAARRLVWEISPDGGAHAPPFEYTQTAARVCRIFDRCPKLEGVLLDDMSSLSVNAGFGPQHIRALRSLLTDKYGALRIWGVVYTMNMRQEGMDQIIKALDLINLWTWHAKDVVDLEKNVAYCEQLCPDTPIVVGLYLYDYGDGRRIPTDLLAAQCETALALAHAGRIEGMLFLTITNDAEVVQWTADWIRRVGDQPLVAR